MASVFALNGDKNYLTDVEIAALADNTMIAVTEPLIISMLETFSISVDSDDARATVYRAVRIANYAREMDSDGKI